MSVFASMRYCLGDPSSHGNLWAALALMPFGLFFDFMDGKVARWRKKSSLMGQELDSLADLVRSGLQLSNTFYTNHHEGGGEGRNREFWLMFCRFPSAFHPRRQHSLLVSGRQSTTASSPSSCSAGSPDSHASTSQYKQSRRMPAVNQSTSRARRFQQRCRSWRLWATGSRKAGSWRTFPWERCLQARHSSSTP
jgi:hypothetical protein